VTSGAFYACFRRYFRAAGLAPTGVHVLRRTAAKANSAGRIGCQGMANDRAFELCRGCEAEPCRFAT